MIDLVNYQKQLDEAHIPVRISQFADQDERIIRCIVGGLLMFAPDKQEVQNAAV